LIERLDPLLTADALGGLDDLDMPLLGEGLDEVVVYSSRLKPACCPEGRSLVSSPPNRSSIEPQSGRRR
jgi:hypothetical protein